MLVKCWEMQRIQRVIIINSIRLSFLFFVLQVCLELKTGIILLSIYSNSIGMYIS